VGIFISVFFLSTVTWANKPLPVYETAQVGETLGILIKPQLESRTSSLERFDNNQIWTRSIEKKDAKFLKLHFKNFQLEPGDKLVIKSKSGRVVEELTGFGPKDLRSFWALSVFGDRADLELHYKGAYKESPFEIDQVVVGKIDFVKDADFFSAESLQPFRPFSICGDSDFEDVKCDETKSSVWKNVMASVGVMTAGGTAKSNLFCSGSNVSPNNYVLTNAHCIRTQGDCDKAEFIFRYYKDGCGGTGRGTSEWVSFRCEKMEVMSPFGDCDPDANNLDFSLNKVAGDPSSQFGYVEIDSSPLTSGEEIYIVQHPDGRPHEITFGSGQMVAVEGRTIRYYDTLDTEPGSSGSPIFRGKNNKLVGLHHCGGCRTNGVGNRGMRIGDIYPLIEDFVCQQGRSFKLGVLSDPFEVNGNGDEFMDPGETWAVRPFLKNSSCELKSGKITVDFAATTRSGVKVTKGKVTYASVLPGKSSSGNSAVEFEIEGNLGCGKAFSIQSTAAYNDGKRIPYQHGVVYSGKIGHDVYNNIAMEDFSSGHPEGWVVVNKGTGTGEFETWKIQDDGTRTIDLTEPFYIVDSDYHETGKMDESLITKRYDFVGYSSAILQFAHEFKSYDFEKGDVEIKSSKTSDRWVRLKRYHKVNASGTEKIDITEYAAGASDVQVRFIYFDAEYDWYWAIDDIYMIGGKGYTCQTFSGK